MSRNIRFFDAVKEPSMSDLIPSDLPFCHDILLHTATNLTHRVSYFDLTASMEYCLRCPLCCSTAKNINTARHPYKMDRVTTFQQNICQNEWTKIVSKMVAWRKTAIKNSIQFARENRYIIIPALQLGVLNPSVYVLGERLLLIYSLAIAFNSFGWLLTTDKDPNRFPYIPIST